VCDSCIETQDHHCVWLNNCVGRRNYRYFFAFVCSATLLGLFLFGASVGHLLHYRAEQRVSFRQAADRWRVPLAMAIYAVLATPYPTALLAYHSLLLVRGETTREYLTAHKFPKHERHRPFSQGNIFRNFVVVLGRPRPPTYLRFKAAFEEGDQRFGPRRGKRHAPLSTEQRSSGGLEMSHVGTPDRPLSNVQNRLLAR
jgi:palmitoyltransferase ZDHHC9/14/18